MNFIPTHQHSDGSLLDGLSRPLQIVKRCKELGYSAAALSDHGNISQSIAFYKECKKHNIKPILGLEAYLCSQDASIKESSNRKLSHLVVLAKNKQGWLNLIKAVSASNQPENFYYRPRLQLEKLASFNNGDWITFSGHPGSDLANCIFTDIKAAYGAYSYEEAKQFVNTDWEKIVNQYTAKYLDLFGKENFYYEIQLIDQDNIPAVQIVAKILRHLGQKNGIKCVATADSHYPTQSDAIDQRILLCSAMETTLSAIYKKLDNAEDVGLGGFFKSNNYHIPSLDEIKAVNTEEEIASTEEIASKCEEYEILSNPILPQYNCPNNLTPDEYLKSLCRDGWKNKIANIIPKEKQSEYVQRIKHEFQVISKANLSSYFLMVQNIVSYVNDNRWLSGAGRGSAAGCMISYLTNITKVDPIKYNLLFERFYNEARSGSLPDIDCDVPINKREKVLEYIKNKYGTSNVCQVITFGRLQGRSAIKEVLRANEACSYDEMNKITINIPDEAAIADDLQEMKEETGESSIIRWALENNSKELSPWCTLKDNGELDGSMKFYFEQAIRLEGTKKSQGKHPAAIIIGNSDLSEICPMVYDKKTNNTISGWDFHDMESVGLCKMDVLGLACLDKIQHCVELINK